LSVLHVRCGTDIQRSLAEAGVPGDYLSWHDPLSQGPCPAGLDREAWRPVRAAFLAETYGAGAGEVERELRAMDERLEAGLEEDEIVLWFEHDLFDQAILAYLLDRLAGSARQGRLTIVTLDRHPGVERFIGLGNLGPEQLAALFAARRDVTDAELEGGSVLWTAFTAPTPVPLAELVAGADPLLPYARRAFRRHLKELPSVHDGLSRTEELALAGVAQGAATPRSAFFHAQDAEEAPWLGDTMFYAIVRRLAEGVPLLRVEGDWPADEPERSGSVRLSLTDEGSAVLAGRADAVRLRGVDRWLGGVRLSGEAVWRWDAARERVVAEASRAGAASRDPP
jgi:uncharacterized protein YgfB (UPF0149 family)